MEAKTTLRDQDTGTAGKGGEASPGGCCSGRLILTPQGCAPFLSASAPPLKRKKYQCAFGTQLFTPHSETLTFMTAAQNNFTTNKEVFCHICYLFLLMKLLILIFFCCLL